MQLLQNGGYPYLIYASGKDIKVNFATASVPEIASLLDATRYVVEAWDQS